MKSYTKTIAEPLSLLTKASSNICTSPLFCQLFHVEFKALGLIWKKTPSSQILMSAFTQIFPDSSQRGFLLVSHS